MSVAITWSCHLFETSRRCVGSQDSGVEMMVCIFLFVMTARSLAATCSTAPEAITQRRFATYRIVSLDARLA